MLKYMVSSIRASDWSIRKSLHGSSLGRIFHYEDNDSWFCTNVGKYIIDFNIHGQDDKLGMKNRLSICGNFMDLDSDGIHYCHNCDWIYSKSVSNVRIFTKSGKMKRVRLLKKC